MNRDENYKLPDNTAIAIEPVLAPVFVYEFIYTPCRFESAFATVSIHKTKKGAEMAMEFHKNETKKAHLELYGLDSKQYNFDSDKLWDIRESKLLP